MRKFTLDSSPSRGVTADLIHDTETSFVVKNMTQNCDATVFARYSERDLSEEIRPVDLYIDLFLNMAEY